MIVTLKVDENVCISVISFQDYSVIRDRAGSQRWFLRMVSNGSRVVLLCNNVVVDVVSVLLKWGNLESPDLLESVGLSANHIYYEPSIKSFIVYHLVSDSSFSESVFIKSRRDVILMYLRTLSVKERFNCKVSLGEFCRGYTEKIDQDLSVVNDLMIQCVAEHETGFWEDHFYQFDVFDENDLELLLEIIETEDESEGVSAVKGLLKMKQDCLIRKQLFLDSIYEGLSDELDRIPIYLNLVGSTENLRKAIKFLGLENFQGSVLYKVKNGMEFVYVLSAQCLNFNVRVCEFVDVSEYCDLVGEGSSVIIESDAAKIINTYNF